MNKFTVELENRDQIQIECDEKGNVCVIHGNGCLDLLNKIKTLKGLLPSPAQKLFVYSDHDHTSLLLNEVLLKALGKWDNPYKEAELCHCRAVPLQKVEAAIISGFHSVDQIAEQTSAGTACGTCRPHTQACIDYRLKDPKSLIQS